MLRKIETEDVREEKRKKTTTKIVTIFLWTIMVILLVMIVNRVSAQTPSILIEVMNFFTKAESDARYVQNNTAVQFESVKIGNVTLEETETGGIVFLVG